MDSLKKMDSKNITSKDKTDIKVVEGSGNKLEFANYKDMDSNNKKAADILSSKGSKEAVKFMFTHPKTGKKLSYSEMRSLYG